MIRSAAFTTSTVRTGSPAAAAGHDPPTGDNSAAETTLTKNFRSASHPLHLETRLTYSENFSAGQIRLKRCWTRSTMTRFAHSAGLA